MTDDLKETKICDCQCHNFGGPSIMHFIECCEMGGTHYIDTDGKISVELWSTAFKKRYKTSPTFTYQDGIPYWVHS